ncbi:hypothetical protein AVEN_245402-1 [Araneus ventricosus]|uniref:Uncharacterized protein n=1 Tax=Araneus ventricosus TaxID=182803 RepID=A0A4Y2HSS8_ARAVE|nr:hypothetical protein AVEN_245402-1 [Araneus ventricosus]
MPIEPMFSHYCLKRTLFQISIWNPDWMPNWLAPDFPPEHFQQFLSFVRNMGFIIQEDDTITQHARAFASDGFTMAQLLFPLYEIEGTLIRNKVLFKQ